MATEETQFLEKIDENFLLCSICFERYRKAKTLPCQHSFCLTCLEETVKRSEKLQCPICRQEYQLPTSGGVEGLPNNMFLNELVEQFLQRDKMLEDSKKCDGCKVGNIKVRCFECSMSLCESCTRPHQRVPSTRSHRLLSLDKYRSQTSTDLVLVPSVLNCNKHPDQPLKFFCDKCDEAICLECTVIDHRIPEHNHRYLKDAATEYVTDVDKMVEKIKVKEAEESRTKVLTKMKTLEENVSVEKEVTKMNKHIENVIKHIQEIGNTFIRQMKVEEEARKSDLQATLKDIESKNSDFVNTREYISHIAKYGSAAQLMTAKKGIESQMKTLLKIDAQVKQVYDEPIVFESFKGELSLAKYVGSLLGVADASQCKLTYIPQCVGSEHEVAAIISVKSREKESVFTSKREVTGKITTPDGNTSQMQVSDNFDGTILLKTGYLRFDIDCKSQRECQLSVSVRNKPIQDEPFKIEVGPILFHASCHGTNVEVLSDGSVAKRVTSYDKAVVFSNRPVNVTESVSLKFTHYNSSYYGVIEFGFTNKNPDDLVGSKLPGSGRH
ncbi:tripartite motif-containing protein 2-like [Glandiceps talaboti]